MTRQGFMATLTTIIGASALFGTTMLVAATGGGDSQTRTPQTQASEQIPHIKALINRVESRHDGQVLGIEREDDHQRDGYEVKLLGSDGQVSKFYVSSAGEEISVAEEEDHDTD